MITYPTTIPVPAIQINGQRPENRTAHQRFNRQGDLRSTIVNSKQNTQLRTHFIKYLVDQLSKKSPQ